MAQIPMGNFGNKGPDPVQHTRISDEGQYQVYGAVKNLGGVIGGIAGAEKQKKDDLSRIQSANALSDYQMKIAELQNDLNRRNKDASLNVDNMPEAYSSALSLIQDNPENFNSWDEATRERFTHAKDIITRNGQLRFNGMYDNAFNVELSNQFTTQNENIVRNASEQIDPDKALEALQIMQNPEYQRIARQLHGENTSKFLLQTASKTAVTNVRYREEISNDIPTLDNYIKELTEDKGIYRSLTPEQKASAIISANGKKTQILNKIEHEKKERESKAENIIENLTDQINTGVPLSSKAWNDAYEVLQGTSFEAALGGLMQQEKEVQGFIRLPQSERDKMLKDAEAAMYNTGQDDPKKTKQRFETLKAVANYRTNLAKEDPLHLVEINTGTSIAPLDVSALADPNRQGDFAQQISNRLITIQALQKQDPSIQTKILKPEELKLLSATLNRIDTDAQLGFFASMSKTLNPSQYNAVMGQLAPEETTKAIAGSMYGTQKRLTVQKNWIRDDVVTDSATVAKAILEGQNILTSSKNEGKSFTAPTEKDFRESFIDYVGNAYRDRPSLASAQMQAARAYYTALSARSGDLSTEIDSKRLSEAIKATQGNVVDFNGSKVFAPWGTSADAFEDQVDSAFHNLVQSGGIDKFYVKAVDGYHESKKTTNQTDIWASPMSQQESAIQYRLPSSFSLKQVGEGKYLLLNGNGKFVVSPQGQKVILDVLKGQ